VIPMRGRVRAGVVLAALVAALLGGCAGPQVTQAPTTGSPSGTAGPGTTSPGTTAPAPTVAGGPPRVMGTVTAGPVCPVETNPPDPACAPRPVAGAIIIATDEAGTEAGRATSAADGTYEMVISQTGSVLLTAQPVTGLMGVPEPVAVELAGPSDVVHVDLQYDTGIR
jgi:hypothetical protein